MNLLDNGQDSLKKAIIAFKDLEKSRLDPTYQYKLKDIVISLHHSIETIFKYMIKEKDEYLIYSDEEDIFKNLAQGNFKNTKGKNGAKTIQFLDAVNRVIVLYNVNIKQEDYNKFSILNEMRNALTHYEIEFQNNEVEHIIALLLPVFLKILKEGITTFDSWAKRNDIYSNVNNITMDVQLWSSKYYFIFREKWHNGKLLAESLDNKPEEKKKIFSQKSKEIEYLECPLCHNKLFHAIGTYIVNTDDVFYLGECEYCKMTLDKKDAQFITINYKDLINYETSGVATMKEAFIDIILSEDIDENIIDIKNKIISEIVSNREAFLDELKMRIEKTICDIYDMATDDYFKHEYYPYNDIMETIIESQHSKLHFEMEPVVNYIINNDEYITTMRNILGIVKWLIDDDYELGSSIYNYIDDKNHGSYHYGMYIDADGEDVVDDIYIEIEINIEYMIDIINSEEDDE